jgi:hypothetical protein
MLVFGSGGTVNVKNSNPQIEEEKEDSSTSSLRLRRARKIKRDNHPFSSYKKQLE